MNEELQMAKILRLTATLSAIFIAFVLTGCGEQEALIKNGPAGPNTGDLIEPLPEGLVPDRQNSRHTANDLNPNIN